MRYLYIFSLIHLIVNGYGQHTIEKVQQNTIIFKDTIWIQFTNSTPSDNNCFIYQLNDSLLFSYDFCSGELKINNLHTGSSSQISINRNSNTLPILTDYFNFSGQYFFFLKTIRIYIFSLNGYLNSSTLSWTFKEDLLVKKKWSCFPPHDYDTVNMRFILPIAVTPNHLIDNDKKWISPNYYSSHGLFALYDMSNIVSGEIATDTTVTNVKTLIGVRDSIYMKANSLPHLDYVNWCFDQGTELIYYNEAASHKIKAINYSGEIQKIMGEIGQNFSTGEQRICITELPATRPEVTIQMNQALIESVSYDNIWIDKEQDKLYRLYTCSLTDTTLNLKPVFNRITAQKKILKSKPKYLQKYSLVTGELESECSVPLNVKIMNISNGVITSNIGYDANRNAFYFLEYNEVSE